MKTMNPRCFWQPSHPHVEPWDFTAAWVANIQYRHFRSALAHEPHNTHECRLRHGPWGSRLLCVMTCRIHSKFSAFWETYWLKDRKKKKRHLDTLPYWSKKVPVCHHLLLQNMQGINDLSQGLKYKAPPLESPPGKAIETKFMGTQK